jgi:hypothetical protein
MGRAKVLILEKAGRESGVAGAVDGEAGRVGGRSDRGGWE